MRTSKNDFFESLEQLQQISDSIPLSMGNLTQGYNDEGDNIGRLRSIVATIKSRDMDYHELSDRMPRKTIKRAPDGSLGPWSDPMTVCDLIWSCCIKLWNACVKLHNLQRLHSEQESGSGDKPVPDQAVLHKEALIRHAVCELAGLIPDAHLNFEKCLNKVQISRGSAAAWLVLGELEQAEICLSLGSRSIKTILDHSVSMKSIKSADWDQPLIMAFDIMEMRIKVLWQLGQHEAATKLISEADAAARGSGGGWRDLVSGNTLLSFNMSQALSTKLLDLAIQELQMKSNAKVLDMLESSLGLTLHALSCPAAEPLKNALRAQEREILIWTMYCLVQNGDGAKAIIRYQALKEAAKTDNDLCAEFPSALALYATAMAMQSKLGEAESALVSLVASDLASAPLCMETIFALLEKGASLEALESSVQILQDRLRGKGDVFEAAESAVRFARMLTTMDPKARTKGEEVDRVLLRLLGHDKLGLGDDLDASQLKTACRQILWNEAIPYFKEKVWDRAFALFNACLPFLDGPKAEFEAKRTMALCCLGSGQSQQALQLLDSAEGCIPSDAPEVATLAFIRLRIALDLHDAGMAETQVLAAARCNGADTAVLEVMCQEAVNAGQLGVAIKVLGKLHDQLILLSQLPEEKRATTPSSLTEATVLRSLVACILNKEKDSAIIDPQTTLELGRLPMKHEPRPIHAELARVLTQASERLKLLGYVSFFGEDEASTSKAAGLDWLSGKAWGAALQAADDHDMDSCTSLLAAYASLLEAHPSRAKVTQARKVAYLMTAVSAIELHKAQPETQAPVLLARKMVCASKEFRAELSGGREDANAMDADEAFLVILELMITVRLKEDATVEVILADSLPKAAALCQPMRLLDLADECSGGMFQNLRVCQNARSLALGRVMADIKPDLALAAKISRLLIKMATTDEDRLHQYKEAASIVQGTAAPGRGDPHGCYPDIELRWLISSCWNRGAYHARFSRFGEAVPFMQLALKLLDHCPSLAVEHKINMTEAMRKAKEQQRP